MGRTIRQDATPQQSTGVMPDKATLTELLEAAWAKAEPSHGVTRYPASYHATFLEMAAAVLAEAKRRDIQAETAAPQRRA